VVKAGDELKYIAADHGVNIFKLIEANKIDDPDSLRVGQVLRIPEN
jgi:nucleoid-associated protein YgaU